MVKEGWEEQVGVREASEEQAAVRAAMAAMAEKAEGMVGVTGEVTGGMGLGEVMEEVLVVPGAVAVAMEATARRVELEELAGA